MLVENHAYTWLGLHLQKINRMPSIPGPLLISDGILALSMPSSDLNDVETTTDKLPNRVTRIRLIRV
jgi:hypothetical protein